MYRDTYTGAWLPPDLATLPGTAHQHAAGYYGQVKRVDEGLGRLRDALISLDLVDDTLLLYTSDHGSHFKTRNAEYKRSPHDGSIRVPLVVDGPGYRGGSRVLTPVSTVDVVPTLLDAAGIDLPAHLDGNPLRHHLHHDGSPSADGEILVQISETEVGRALRTTRWKYHVTAPEVHDQPGAARYREQGLYDLEADPYELDNLIDSANHHQTRAILRRQLIDKIQAVEHTTVHIDGVLNAPRPDRYPDTTVQRKGFKGRPLE